MRIGELAKVTGVSVETIRFYEAEGLLPEPRRGLNNYREYAMLHRERLQFIRHCRSLDMSLDDVKVLLQMTHEGDSQAHAAHRLVESQIAKVDERIRELNVLKKHLQELQSHCNGHHQGKACGILVSLGASED